MTMKLVNHLEPIHGFETAEALADPGALIRRFNVLTCAGAWETFTTADVEVWSDGDVYQRYAAGRRIAVLECIEHEEKPATHAVDEYVTDDAPREGVIITVGDWDSFADVRRYKVQQTSGGAVWWNMRS
jgi:hypothetical protein